MQSVCKDCTDRSAMCHGFCERYLAAREDHIKQKREINKRKNEDKEYVDYVINSKATIDSRMRSQYKRKQVRKHEV